MEDLVRYIVESLVQYPEQVSITRVDNPEGYTLEVRVAPDDMGKVIGKQGRIVRAIRTVVKAAAAAEKQKVTVEVI